LNVGRLLCMEWQGPEPDRTESIMLVYDGGKLADPSGICLPVDELRSFRFVEQELIGQLMNERLARRTRSALAALASGVLVEMEHGAVLSASTATWQHSNEPY
jgi:8-oxo-dGTP diphosphatase